MSEYENLMWRNSLVINNPTEFCGHRALLPLDRSKYLASKLIRILLELPFVGSL
jgi:hypothetical protein